MKRDKTTPFSKTKYLTIYSPLEREKTDPRKEL